MGLQAAEETQGDVSTIGKKGLEQKSFLAVGFSARVHPSQPDERTVARPYEINPKT